MYIFIADTHLIPESKERTESFLAWLAYARVRADRIYILGDLFEYWYSGMEKDAQEIISKLADPSIFIITGNRDFLLPNSKTALNIIRGESYAIELYGRKLLLAHGHMFVKNDYGFKLLHKAGWPLARLLDRLISYERKKRLAGLFVKASGEIRPSFAEIEENAAAKHGSDMLICGHLHRPVMSDKLIVLPAFADSGSWLEWDGNGPRLANKLM